MKSLEQAYTERLSVLEAVEAETKLILENFCRRRNFLLASRTKDMESIRDKLETGRFASVDSIDDAIAFAVVIDTHSQEPDVRDFVEKAFTVLTVKSGTTLQDERIFDFDCTRIYCRLVDGNRTGSRVFHTTIEIQIRTILQHAWSKVTHAYVYKANAFDARAARLAAELLAQLESIDRSLSGFQVAVRGVKSVNRREMIASSATTTMIDELVREGIIPGEMRPKNGRRLGDNIYSAIRSDMRRNYKKPVNVIRDFFTKQREKFPRSITLFQLAVVALHEADALEHGTPQRPRRYYITDELVSLFPSVKEIPNRIAIE